MGCNSQRLRNELMHEDVLLNNELRSKCKLTVNAYVIFMLMKQPRVWLLSLNSKD